MMGPGHLAIAFAAKPLAPRVPLWVLLPSSVLPDILGFAFRAVGIEQSGISVTDAAGGLMMLSPGIKPWSHGLVMSVVWAILAGAIAFLVYRERRASLIMALVVFSHWVLDFIVHPPELPLLFGGSQMVGLGLWTSGRGLIISIILEALLFAGGTTVYLVARRRSAVRPRDVHVSPS